MPILVLPVLTVLPGTWISFGLPLGEFRWQVRLALGVGFSPAVLAIELLALKVLGFDFAHAAPMILAVNLPAAALLIRRLPEVRRPHFSATFAVASLLFLILAASVMLPWFLVPRYRLFSWHALLHTDVIYALTRHGVLPEEPEMAGLTLAYDWVGESYWSTLGWLSNWSPTSMYPVTNLIWLLISFVLAYEIAHVALGLHSSTALLAVGLLLLGTQMVGSVAWLIVQDVHRWAWYLGDVRNTALLMAHQGFEDMPFAIALVLGLTLVCLLGLQRKVAWIGALVCAVMISIALVYPILFPMACLMAAGTAWALAGRWAKSVPAYEARELWALIAGWAVSISICVAFLAVISGDRGMSSVHFFESGKLSRSVQVTSSLLAYLIPAIPFIAKSFASRSGPGLVLAFTGFGSAALYVFCGLNQLESKLIAAATIPFAFLSAAGLEPVLEKLPRARWALAVLVPLALAAVQLSYAYRLGAGIPSNLGTAPRINEESFWIALSPDEEDAAWTRAVRESTPADTVVVARKPGIHLAPFVARSLYFPSDYDEGSAKEYTVSPAGYSVDKRYTLLQQRGYSGRVWDQRLRTIEALYGETDPTTLVRTLQKLQELKRPIAIYFKGEGAPALVWLREHHVGKELFSDNRGSVWFIEFGTPITDRAF